MRVGIDCRTILNPVQGEAAGVGHYTYFLVKHILELDAQNEYVLFFDYRMKREGTQEFRHDNVKICYFPFSSYRKFLPFAYSHMLTAAALLKERLDLFHSPTMSLPLTYPKTTVVTAHDLAIFVNPAWFPSQIFSTRLLVPQALKRAKKIIAVSQSTKNDLKEIFNVSGRKVTIVHEGVSTQKLNLKDKHVNVFKKFGLGRRYLLFVGTLEARKNLIGLIETFAALVETKPKLMAGVELVLAGAVGFKGDDVIEKIQALKLQKRVHYIGYVTHNEKMNLMSNALAFVFPSLYEGFGLPVLEAMNLGTPVITSKISSLPEISGEAALLVDPEDAADLAAGIERIISDDKLRRKLIDRGLKQAKAFSWMVAARETINVYKSVLKDKLIEEVRAETGS